LHSEVLEQQLVGRGAGEDVRLDLDALDDFEGEAVEIEIEVTVTVFVFVRVERCREVVGRT